MALYLIAIEDLRNSCRQRLESCELWLRRVIHDQLFGSFGASYIDVATLNGQPLFRTAIRNRVRARLAAEPNRYSRAIDTLLLDDLSAILCRQDVFKAHFSTAFRASFPLGNEHLRTVLDRLVPIRNALSHANSISLVDAERVLCYSSDIIGALIAFHAGKGMQTDFDAPSFTRVSDSLGNVLVSPPRHVNWSETVLRCGESIRMEVEVDAHYGPSEYVVAWVVANISHGESATGPAFSLTLLPRHVGESFIVSVTLRSTKAWHRHQNFDDMLSLRHRVLPPL